MSTPTAPTTLGRTSTPMIMPPGHREPRSTSFWIAGCPLSQSGHCAARGSHAHHRADQLADWPRSAVRFPIKCSNHELSYALLARARESFELCSHFKSLPPVSDRELSTDLTWRAHRRKPEFPALGSGTQSRCVLGERGVKLVLKINKYWRATENCWVSRLPAALAYGLIRRGCMLLELAFFPFCLIGLKK